ncbi:oxysterol-binding protein-related protein 11-like isoform X2 [Periplaneta americana]
MSSDKLRQQFEGQLCKYTNVMKGWQFRWFVLDPETGVLDYFLNESERKQRPRGSVHLAAAVISPSDEDSNTFTVNSATGEMFKLRAADARARHEWVSRLRAVAEMHTMAIAQSNPPLPPREHHVSSHASSSMTGSGPQQGTRVHCSLAVLDAFSAARDHIHRADQSSYALSRAIEELPGSGPGLRCVDEPMLLLKATSQTTVSCLSQCLNILQQQQIAPAHAPLPSTSRQTLAQQSQHSASSARKAVLPVQYDDDDSKKSSQHELSSPWTETMPVTSTLSLHTASEDSARDSSRDDVTDDEDSEEGGLVPVEENKPLILHLLSQLKLGMDLTRVVLPTSILERRSLLEMFADCMGHPQLFVHIPDESTPFGRMMAVLQWYLTSFHVGRSDSTARKPYNPIIGETFHCSWRVQDSKSHSPLNEKSTSHCQLASKSEKENITVNLTDSDPVCEIAKSQLDVTSVSKLMSGDSCSTVTELGSVNSVSADNNETEIFYTAEQVSHHPPVTAFYVECPTKKMCLNASIWTKSNFSGMSIGVNMIGELSLHLCSHGEHYDFTLPSAHVRSLISVPWVELGGKVIINCQTTGYCASIIFHTKPFFGDKVHQVTAEVKNRSGIIMCKVQGEWNSHYEFTYADGGSSVMQLSDLTVYRKRVKRFSAQSANESRKLWFDVTQALRVCNINAATGYKQQLEEQQRIEEKIRRDTGTEYQAKFFHKVGDNWIYNNILCEV